MDKQVEYSKRKQRIEVDNLELIKEKLQTQLAKYESIFKNEFVMKIKANVEAAISDIKDINKQLKLLQFNTKYQFEVKEVKGLSDFARMLEYGSYLQVTNWIDNGKFTQMALGDVVNYDEDEAIKREDEIKVIVNRILSKDNDAILLEFADYRNYMEYDVIGDDGENSNLRLSRIAGYNSGAGTQTPYTIILSAVLALYYNARSNSTRLIFIDEPFEKMSDKNIKSMLEFFKSQNFQVIFCAPPNRLDSIGKECDAIIPIQRINKSNMTLGVIKFNA